MYKIGIFLFMIGMQNVMHTSSPLSPMRKEYTSAYDTTRDQAHRASRYTDTTYSDGSGVSIDFSPYVPSVEDLSSDDEASPVVPTYSIDMVRQIAEKLTKHIGGISLSDTFLMTPAERIKLYAKHAPTKLLKRQIIHYKDQPGFLEELEQELFPLKGKDYVEVFAVARQISAELARKLKDVPAYKIFLLSLPDRLRLYNNHLPKALQNQLKFYKHAPSFIHAIEHELFPLLPKMTAAEKELLAEDTLIVGPGVSTRAKVRTKPPVVFYLDRDGKIQQEGVSVAEIADGYAQNVSPKLHIEQSDESSGILPEEDISKPAVSSSASRSFPSEVSSGAAIKPEGVGSDDVVSSYQGDAPSLPVHHGAVDLVDTLLDIRGIAQELIESGYFSARIIRDLSNVDTQRRLHMYERYLTGNNLRNFMKYKRISAEVVSFLDPIIFDLLRKQVSSSAAASI